MGGHAKSDGAARQEMKKYAEVALPVPVRETFLYLVPERLVSSVAPGVRVLVPFGPRSLTGVVVEIKDNLSKKDITLKEIDQVLDETPLISEDLLDQTRKLSEFHYSPWGELLQHVFPPSLFVKSRLNVVITEKGNVLLDKGGLTDEEIELLKPLKKRPYSYQYLKKKYAGDHFSRTFIRLEKKGLLEKNKTIKPPVRRRKEKDKLASFQLEMGFTRDRESERVLNEIFPHLGGMNFVHRLIRASLEKREEIYLELIKGALEKQLKVLVLLPEIPLAKIFQEKIKKYLAEESVVFHGKLSEKAREREWMKIRSGQIPVILGSRTALLAPVDKYGLVIVEQEENESFDQSDTGQFDIRKGAWIKAEDNSAVLILGSSSPTVENYYRAKKMGYLHFLKDKSDGRQIDVVEIKREEKLLAPGLLRKIEETVSSDRQVLLFVTRRGYASYVFCPNCRYVPKCKNCEISLTYHKQENKLICHYCNYSIAVSKTCIKCGSKMIQNRGIGTELITEKIKQSFPKARVAAFDRDFVKRRSVREKVLRDLEKKKIDILVGTRLLANQYRLPPVAFVGILFPEEILLPGDFRSGQKTYQAIRRMLEFADRSRDGQVMIQTDQPFHYCIQSAVKNDYDSFYHQELEFRKLLHYPPFSVMAEIIFQGDNLRTIARETRKFISQVKAQSDEIEVLGPALAPLFKLRGKVRVQAVLKAEKKQILDAVLPEILKKIRTRFTLRIYE
ncbi:MAG: primosomal protein N' [Candidatus Aminicenantes bacterium]|nr:primosomal protein N' [Candidatus Aminicenantes bacterium]